ncbi:MAG: MmcQ/YjbR family DNA-binding protein [Gemmatimonadales bacterium]
MATQADVRRIALSLPGAVEEAGHFAFLVQNKDKAKPFAWVWKERVDPRKARVPQPKVIALRVASLDDKEFLLGLDQEKFFTEPHYNGYPAILVRLPAVTARELRSLITEAWRCQAPRDAEPKKKVASAARKRPPK